MNLDKISAIDVADTRDAISNHARYVVPNAIQIATDIATQDATWDVTWGVAIYDEPIDVDTREIITNSILGILDEVIDGFG